MKIPGKKFALVAAPLLVAGGMLGVPLAGSAHALERPPDCHALRAEAKYDYESAGIASWDANAALEAGDWSDYLYYSYLEALNDQKGDDATTWANSHGC
jgi:hypothetical protein